MALWTPAVGVYIVSKKLKVNLYALPNIIRVIYSKRIRWGGHVARTGKGKDVPVLN
jgi:hypothetical protein